jgi:hypothetical protein
MKQQELATINKVKLIRHCLVNLNNQKCSTKKYGNVSHKEKKQVLLL